MTSPTSPGGPAPPAPVLVTTTVTSPASTAEATTSSSSSGLVLTPRSPSYHLPHIAPSTSSRTLSFSSSSTTNSNNTSGSSSNTLTRALESKILSQDLTSHYKEIAVIGSGTYGTVWKAQDLRHEGRFVALKKLLVPISDGVPMSTLREIGLLKLIDRFEHPNIVRLLDIRHGPRLKKEHQLSLYLVLELVEQDLATYIERCPPPGLSMAIIKDIMFQILCGVDFLHIHRIVHRDLKPENILVTTEGRIKLTDFGLSKTYDFNMRLTTVVVSLWYRSPEVLLGAAYATPIDLWSCGCIMAELYSRKPDIYSRMPLFMGQSEADQLARIFEIIGTPREEEWPEEVSIPWSSFSFQPGFDFSGLFPEMCSDAIHLMQLLLVFNDKFRVCASDALQHPYFQGEGFTLPPMQQLVCANPTGQLSPNTEAPFLNTPTSDDSGQPADSQPDM